MPQFVSLEVVFKMPIEGVYIITISIIISIRLLAVKYKLTLQLPDVKN